MRSRPTPIWLASLAFLGSAAALPASALSIYDPGLGSLPAAQGWSTAGVGPFTQAVVAGAYALDTTAAIATSAGSAFGAPTLLDTVAGFTLDFGLALVSESHAADNQRAGFSLIVTGADPRQSLEIGFWQDGLFAYTAGFVPGPVTSFATGVQTAYSLVVANDRYSLSGNGASLLAGSLVDYTSRGIAPYTTAGVIFFGDDTSRAQSSSRLGAVSLGVAAVPEPQTYAVLALGLLAIAARRRTASFTPSPATVAAGRARRSRRT